MAQTKSNTKTNSNTKRQKENSNKKKKKSESTLFAIVKNKEACATVILLFGVFFSIVALFPGGIDSLWNKFHTFWITIFGMLGYYMPLCCFVLSIIYFAKKTLKKFLAYAIEGGISLILISSIIHIIAFSESGTKFGDSLLEIFGYGMDHLDWLCYLSGEIGAIFGGVLFAVCANKPLCVIICLILIVILFMISFRISVGQVVDKAKKPASKILKATDETAKNIGNKMRENSENRRRDKEEQKIRDRQNTPKNTSKYKNDSVYGNRSGSSQNTDNLNFKSDTIVDNDYEDDGYFTKNQRQILGMLSNEKGEVPADSHKSVVSISNNPLPEKSSEEHSEGKIKFNDVFTQIIEKEGHPPIIPMTEEPSPAVEPKTVKPVKAAPLSNEESQEISDTLSDALDVQPVKEYVFPPLDILNMPEKRDKYFDEKELYRNGDKLIEALASFNVSASVSAIVPGPTVTRYELTPAPGVKISKFTGLADDLALCLAAPAGIRIEAPIPNKSAIGIEIPNKDKLTITFREILDTPEFNKAKGKLTVGLGKNISGDVILCNIAKMPHLLVAGTTGSGKSVLMNSMIVSLLYRATPQEVRMILIDPKQVEFGMYNGIPHLLVPVVTDARKASGALAWAVTEMLDRYRTFNENKVRDLDGYNKLRESDPELECKPQIVIFIDELADLMIAAPGEVEDSIQRVAQMGRAAGIHLVVATQRPSVDVITGVIKANMSSRIALTVKSQIDSRTIIDAAGAEKLTGHGDMLYAPVDYPKPLRVQGCYLSDREIADIVKFLKQDNGEAVYSPDIEEQIIKCIPQGKKKPADFGGDSGAVGGIEGISSDDKFAEVMDFILANPDQVSISSLQRHLRIGFARAGRLIDELLEKGYIENVDGSKTKKVVITQNEWYETLAMSRGGNQSKPEQITMFDQSAADDIFINPDTVTTVTDADMGFSGDF